MRKVMLTNLFSSFDLYLKHKPPSFCSGLIKVFQGGIGDFIYKSSKNSWNILTTLKFLRRIGDMDLFLNLPPGYGPGLNLNWRCKILEHSRFISHKRKSKGLSNFTSFKRGWNHLTPCFHSLSAKSVAWLKTRAIPFWMSLLREEKQFSHFNSHFSKSFTNCQKKQRRARKQLIELKKW